MRGRRLTARGRSGAGVGGHEYFNLSVGQTLKSWSIMETLLSVSGLVFVLILGLVV